MLELEPKVVVHLIYWAEKYCRKSGLSESSMFNEMYEEIRKKYPQFPIRALPEKSLDF